MGELFDVLTLLAYQGPDCLSWNKEVDNLLFWSLLLKENKEESEMNKSLRKRLQHFGKRLCLVVSEWKLPF